MAIQKDLGRCCLCIPIRIGVGILSLITFLHGIVCALIVFNKDVRLLPGGYNPTTQYIGVWLGMFGMLFGLIGVLGAADNKVAYIQAYNWFQWSKLSVGVVIFVMDLLALRGCEAYPFDIQSQIKYNVPMDIISSKGLCAWTRNSYILGYAIDFVVNFYMAWVGQTFIALIRHNPAYLIRFEDGYQNTIPTRVIGEPANYYIDKKAQAEYEGLKASISAKLETETYGSQALNYANSQEHAGMTQYGSLQYRGDFEPEARGQLDYKQLAARGI